MLASLTKAAAFFGLTKKESIVCDRAPGLSFTFEPERYMGTWYEIAHSKDESFQPNAWACNQATYSDLDATAGTFKVYNSSKSQWGGPRFGVHGDAKCPKTQYGEGQCFVKFFFQKYYDEPNYEIIDTDYENYSIVYSCHEDDMAFLWMLSRKPTIDSATQTKMMETAKAALPHYDFAQLIFDD